MLSFVRQNFLNAPDLSVGEADFYAVRVIARIGQQIFDDADGLFAGALVLFEDDGDAHSGADVLSFAVFHKFNLKTISNYVSEFRRVCLKIRRG